ncbi:ankyrin repeat domain-containing protein 28 [Colletotrichum tofieldiae]|nr:ankyrin repeat domain-containing protein 28 [Colletotrichum tofieldiae]
MDGELLTEDRVSPSPKDANSDEQDPNLAEKNISTNWLAVALDRASALGLDGIINKLLSLVAGERAETPIHRAALAGASEVLKLLLDHGAAIEITSKGWLPLELASAMGNFAATEVLVQHKNLRHYSTPVPGRDPLYLAVSCGFIKTAKVLLCHEADPNAYGPSDETVLMAAIRSDRIDLCRLLLEHGSDPDSTPERAKSPLIQAVMFKNLDMVKLLVEKGPTSRKEKFRGQAGTGRRVSVFVESAEIVEYLLSKNADPHVSDEDGWSTLWAAARYGCEEIVRMLIEANADINKSCTESKTTPLHEAVEYPQVVKILLEHGANMNNQAAGGETPLSYAIAENHLETVKIMLADSRNRADLSLNEVHKALAYAVSLNYVEMVSEVLEAGADVNFAGEDCLPLVCLAIALENQTMLRAILEHNPDLSNSDTKGNQVLHYINCETPVESVRLAVNAGASLTALNRFYCPPLDEAIASSCKEEVVRYLLSKDATLAALTSSLSEDARGPIHTACKGSSLLVVQLLLDKGADINLASAGPFGTPLIAATLRNTQADRESAGKVINYLLDKGADPSLGAGLFTYPIISACLAGSPQVVKRFLDCNSPINVKDTLDRTPAHLACYNSLEVLNLLESPASDFACVDKVGRVPLHYAVLSGQPDVVEAALARSKQAGIDIDVQDSDGWTPLLWAARASMVWRWDDRETAKHDEVVSLLLREGARTDIHGRGSDKSWSVSDVAFYHQADSIADLFKTPGSSSERRPNVVKKGRPTDDWYCDCCLVKIWGVYFVCSTCTDFGLCFKCYMSKSLIHPQHEFADEGFEWDEDIGDGASVASVREPPGSVDGREPPEESTEALDDRFDDEIVGDD